MKPKIFNFNFKSVVLRKDKTNVKIQNRKNKKIVKNNPEKKIYKPNC